MFRLFRLVIKKNSKKGFTLFELIISMSIVAILAGISFFGLNAYSDYFSLKDAVRGIDALARKAQGYAINIQNVNSGVDSYTGQYGLEFSTAYPTEIIFFSDIDDNEYYNADNGCSDDECIERTVLGRGIKIESICYVTIGNSIPICDGERVDIVYKRPKPDAYIKIDKGDVLSIEKAIVTFSSPKGKKYSVTFGTTGYISNE